MKKILTILILLISIITLINKKAHSQTPELMFVINKSGDSLVTSKIFMNETDEDKVTFLLAGTKKQLLAKEVKSYFKEGRKVSIKLGLSNTSKLATIVLRGNITLAKSMSIEGKEMFYINYKEDWVRLDYNSTNLKEEISELVFGFEKVIRDKKIHYNLVSLGDAVLKYNDLTAPNSIGVGSFKFNERLKIGIYGLAGIGKVNVGNSIPDFNATPSIGVGVATSFQYSRLVSLLVQCRYSVNNWENEEWDIMLKTIDLTPLISFELYNKSNYFKVSAAMGLNANIDLASNFIGLQLNNINSFGLTGLSLGYDFQLHGTFGENIDVFTSYQILPKRKSQNYDITISEQSLTLKSTSIQLGFIYYI